MSDLTVPNIDFDTETSLTEGPGHDDILGTSGNDLVIGAVDPDGFTTLNPADIVRGGDGGDNMLSITFTGENPSAVGFLARDMDVFQMRNFASGTASVNMIDVTGTSTLWLNSNTGDSQFDFVQNVMGLVATGGMFHTDINYAAGVAAGADQEILVQGTNADFDISGAVSGLWLNATGAASIVDIDSAATHLMVEGDAGSLSVDTRDGNYLADADATAFNGNLTLRANMDVSGGATATVDTGNGNDKVFLDNDGDGDNLTATTGEGNDKFVANGFGDTNVDLGADKNKALLGWTGDSIYGNVTVNGMNGKDVVKVGWATGDLTANVAKGNNKIEAYVAGSATIDAKGGNDKLLGYIGSDLDANLRGGQNYVDIDAWNVSNLLTKGGNDTVDLDVDRNIGSSNNWVDVGGGDNDVDITFGTGWGGQDWAYLRAGDGNDSLTAASGAGDELVADLGEGDNDATITNMSTNSADITFGAGADEVFTTSRGLVGTDDIDFGGGNDKLYVNNLEILGSGDLTGVTAGSLENIYFGEVGASSTVDFNGATSGANTAGVMTYHLNESGLDYSYNLDNLADGVTLNLKDNGGTESTFALDLAGSSGTANVNFTITSTSTFNWFNMTDVATLKLDSDEFVNGIQTLQLGNSGFTGDADLTKVELTGNSQIHLWNVDADNLAMIDGSSMNTQIRLDLDDVAGNTTVITGGGNDIIRRDDAGANFDIDTGGGSDRVLGSGGDDNIKLGLGNDWVEFTASTLDDFDTVDGGGGTDTVRITSGTLNLGDDSLFFGFSEVENWVLNSSSDTLILGNIAQSSGLERIYLNGVTPPNGTTSSGDDSITLKASFINDLEVTLGYQSSSEDTVDAGASAAELTVRATALDVVDNDDEITGGTGDSDELQIYNVNSSANIVLGGFTGVENFTVTAADTTNISLEAVQSNFDGSDTQVANRIDTITVSTRTDITSQGDLDFDGSDATDYGKFDVIGGYGHDDITGGSGADTITTNQGNDTVHGGDGNDIINAGGGENSTYTGVDRIWGEGGDDTITTGYSGDWVYGGDGMDNINSGDGGDYVEGGAEADTIDVGLSDGNIDTVAYDEHTDSFGGSVDQVSNFVGGAGGDKVNLDSDDLSDDDGQYFVGNGATFGQAQGLVTAGDDIIDVVFQVDDEVLWVDINDDGTLNNDDLQIHLIGVTGLQDNGLGGSANLVLHDGFD